MTLPPAPKPKVKPPAYTPYKDPARIGNNMARAMLPFGPQRDALAASLEGGTHRLKTGETSFVASPANLRAVQAAYPTAAIALPALPQPALARALRATPGHYAMASSPFGQYQQDAYELCRDKVGFGLFMDTGTGKTKVAIDATGYQFAQGWITGVLVITLRGVHAQWCGKHAHSPFPRHMGTIDGKPVRYRTYAWDGKNPPPFPSVPDYDVLEVFTVNFEALVRSQSAPAIVNAYIKRHAGRLRTIVDESHKIANFSSGQTECCVDIGERSASRLAMSGTPVPKNPEDEWVQSLFIDEDIFGFQFRSSFRAKYARMLKGDVIGWKNLEEMRAIMQPHVFRITSKDALGLPDKVYDRFYFDMPKQVRTHYNELKRNFLTQVETGEIVTVQNAAVLLMRLQQITCGSLIDEDGTRHELENARAVALEQLLQKFDKSQRIVIWARFKRDINDITAVCARLGGGGIGYLVGGQDDLERARIVADWRDSNRYRFMVGNPAAGGTGTDGLQYNVAATIYYSNSFNSVDRWQSEDRTYRIGTDRTSVPLYYDIIANNSVDERILRNLREKKDMADMLLGDIVDMIRDS